MAISAAIPTRRTSADVVFDHLYEQIISLQLLPGSKMSEADVAVQFGVSRQPVREAFNRLGNMGLLRIQPQRATLVQKFSLDAISAARFIRLAVELEVVRCAVELWSDDFVQPFQENLAAQRKAVKENDARAFHALDEEFHELIADVAQKPSAFDLVRQKKAQIDRICVLSLKQSHEMEELVTDHSDILECLKSADQQGAEKKLRKHLSRIEKTIDCVHQNHLAYFEE